MIWIDGQFVDNEYQISVFDKLNLGMSVFTSILVEQGKPVRLKNHISRLARHAKVISLSLQRSEQELQEIALELVKRTPNLNDKFGAIRIQLSGGVGARGLDYPAHSRLFMSYTGSLDPRYAGNVKILCHPTYRRNAEDPLSTIKSGNYGLAALAKLEAKAAGFDDVIFLNHKGNVTCASTANIFIQHAGQYYTPPLSDGVMDGVMREHLVSELEVKELSLKLEQLESADYIWLTNSFGIRSVKQVNGIVKEICQLSSYSF